MTEFFRESVSCVHALKGFCEHFFFFVFQTCLLYALLDCASFSVLTLPSRLFYSLCSDLCQVRSE